MYFVKCRGLLGNIPDKNLTLKAFRDDFDKSNSQGLPEHSTHEKNDHVRVRNCIFTLPIYLYTFDEYLPKRRYR